MEYKCLPRCSVSDPGEWHGGLFEGSGGHRADRPPLTMNESSYKKSVLAVWI